MTPGCNGGCQGVGKRHRTSTHLSAASTGSASVSRFASPVSNGVIDAGCSGRYVICTPPAPTPSLTDLVEAKVLVAVGFGRSSRPLGVVDADSEIFVQDAARPRTRRAGLELASLLAAAVQVPDGLARFEGDGVLSIRIFLPRVQKVRASFPFPGQLGGACRTHSGGTQRES
eukprot:363813-Rhodomonas_salina.4